MSIIDNLFGRRGDVMPRQSPGHPMFGPESDPFIGNLVDIPVAPGLDGLTAGIEYIDSLQQFSSRTIRCKRAARSGEGNVYITAFCLLRQDWRSFRVDRIEAVFDYRTGEILGDGRTFFAPFVGEVAGRNELAYWPGFEACREAVRVLIFLAMADGELHDRELAVICNYARDRIARETGGTVTPVSANMAKWIGSQTPTRKQAMAGLRHTMDNAPEGAHLADAIFSVMLADGRTSDEEMELAKRLVGSMERREKRNSAF